MPRLSPDTIRDLGGPDLTRDWESKLQSGELVSAGRLVDYFDRLRKSEWIKLDTRNYAEMVSYMSSRLAMSKGLVGTRVESLGVIFDAAADLAVGVNVDWEDVARKTLRGAAQRLDQSLRDTATGVPVLGWIVEIGLLVYDLSVNLKNLLNLEADAGRPLPSIALLYDKGADQDVVRAMLDRVDHRDWTEFFIPSVGRIDSIKVTDLEFTDRGFPNGMGVEFSGVQEQAFSVIPSLARIAGGYYQTRDLPYALPFSNWTAYSQEVGDVLPSACQMGLTLWETVMKNGPAMFTIDPDAIVRKWENYFTGVHAVGQAASLVPSEFLRAALGYLSVWAVDQRPGQPGWQFSVIQGIDFHEIPAKYRHPPYTLDQVVTWQVRERWERRAWRALGTLTCAYVNDDSPAIAWAKRSRPEMYSRWENMRRILLSHSAVRHVDLSMIPDTEYRNAVRQSQRTPTKSLTLGDPGDPRPRPKVTALVHADDRGDWEGIPNVDPIDEPEGAGASPVGVQVAKHTRDPGGGPGAGAAVIGIASAAAVAWFVSKGGGR